MDHAPYLFHVKDDDELQGGDCRKEGREEGTDPANGLSVNDPQDVVGNGELLLAPALEQLPGGAVGHEDPENKQDNFSPGQPVSAKTQPPNQGCFHACLMGTGCSYICKMQNIMNSGIIGRPYAAWGGGGVSTTGPMAVKMAKSTLSAPCAPLQWGTLGTRG